jgi:hypothetical protein
MQYIQEIVSVQIDNFSELTLFCIFQQDTVYNSEG